MSQSINNTIHLRGDYTHVEQKADAGINPGNLLENTATGLKKHATAGGFAELIFAKEDALQGLTTADAYTTGDIVLAAIEKSGNLVNALLLAGSNYAAGAKLISDGAGRLKPTTGSPTQHIATLIEAVDLSDSDAVDTLAVVRIL